VKELWLDKSTGGVCLSISSKGLRITGIDDRRYWNHVSTEESRWDNYHKDDVIMPLFQFHVCGIIS
jgi:hypothetical protein